MENQTVSSSNSSTSNTQKLKGILVVREESEENNNLKQGSPHHESSGSDSLTSGAVRGGTTNPPLDDDVRRGKEIMKFFPTKSNKIFSCQFCKKEFSSSQALGGHQNGHKKERDLNKKRKEMEDNLFLGGINVLSHENHLGINVLSHENHLGIKFDFFNNPMNNAIHPPFNIGGVTRGNMNMNMMTSRMVPPTLNFTGSSSRAPPLSYRNIRPFVPRDVPPFMSLPTTNLVTKENVLSEENLISKIGVINNNHHPEDGNPESPGIDLTLSL